MAKWSYFFLSVPIVTFGLVIAAPWLGLTPPENVSPLGRRIDFLFYFLWILCGLVFLGTQWFLFDFLRRYGQSRRFKRPLYTHGSRKAEILWTIIPGIGLVIIFAVQLPVWRSLREGSKDPNLPTSARVIARQFEWRIVYPGPDGVLDTPDDIHTVNELHIAKNKPVKIDLQSMDVIHSFYLPNFRVKQDAVPGMTIPVWFESDTSSLAYQARRPQLKKSDLTQTYYLVEELTRPNPKDPVFELLQSTLSQSTRAQSDALVKAWANVQRWDALQTRKIQEQLETVRPQLISDLNRALLDPTFSQKLQQALAKRQGDQWQEGLPFEVMFHLQLPGERQFHAVLARQLLHVAVPEHFRPISRQMEIVCAELCGRRHAFMKGRVVVHETQEELNAWLTWASEQQEVHQ